jgi:hypothetical protein
MTDVPGLADVLRDALPSSASPAAKRAAEALRETYRSGAPPTSLAIADSESAAAHAAYRMPATRAAVGAALAAAPPDLALDPTRHLDLGGGTGAAVRAVHGRWPGRVRSRVLDASPSALALGADLTRRSADPDLARIHWEQVRFDLATTLPGSDLITACYLLGELAPESAARGHSAPRRTRPWAAAALTHRPRRRSPSGTLARARAAGGTPRMRSCQAARTVGACRP